MDVMAMARAERADLAELLATLDEAQWAAPSLCEGWSVRDVVAHLVSYEDLGPTGMVRRALRGRLVPHRMNQVGVDELRDLEPEHLLRLLREYERPQGITAGLGGGIALVETLIHHQDIRRPLGLRRAVPADRLRYALPYALTAPRLRGVWHVRGVRVVADDLDWAAGRGPEARGPAEAVLMTIAGRTGAAEELAGPGRDLLVDRMPGRLTYR
jgi:uncharacterized protein (TIGR03083 family)